MANQPAQPWINPGVFLVANPNALPANPEKWLPKYNPNDALPIEEHLNNFMLAMNLNGVAHEDVVIILFPYTFQGSAGSWYFSLPSGLIRDWDTFQEVFLAKFDDDRIIESLINDLSNLKANSNERIKDFNSKFNKLLNKILVVSKPTVDVQIEWYISSLPSNIAIFVDRVNKATLVENMKEALSIERIIISLEKRSQTNERKSRK